MKEIRAEIPGHWEVDGRGEATRYVADPYPPAADIEQRMGWRFLILLREAAILAASIASAYAALRAYRGIGVFAFLATVMLARWRFERVIRQRLGE